MKTRKRTLPADFGAAADERLVGAADDAARDLDDALDFADPTPSAPLDPPPRRGAVAAVSSRTPVRQAESETEYGAEVEDPFRPPPAWPIYLVAFVVAVLWALAPIAFAVGYRAGVAPLLNDTFAMVVFGLLAIGPAFFVFGAAYMLRQGQKLGAEARRAKAMAEDMLVPAIAAAARAGQVVQVVRDEILHAGAAADQARESLLALREVMASETEKLAESTQQSVHIAHQLAGTLGRERIEMGAIAQTLDLQAAKVVDSIGQQARMVAEASDLAETQLREAEATLSARAADLAAAASETSDAARTAGEDLTRHIARLETAGVGVSEQVRAVEGGLSEQRTALIALAQALKSDHQGFSADAEAHAATLGEFISQARLSAAEMNDRALKGGDSLRQLMADAAAQFRDLAETAQAEREEFGLSTVQSLESVSAAAAEQRAKLEAQTRAAIDALAAAAEETRAAAASHAASAREQVDQLSEAAFSAGQKANQVFEARLAEARALVEQSSVLVDQAGSATAQKLEAGAASARATLAELQDMMSELEQRAARLPVSARGQVDLVRATVAQGMDELMAQARRTAEEAQSIDAAFQDRVRRNFEMLSEAVRLMGSAAAAPPLPLAALQPPPISSTARTVRRRPEPEPTPEPAEDALEDVLELEDLMEPAPKTAGPVEPDAPSLADKLRPRLKLTPTATDEEFSAVFDAAGGPPVDGEDPPEGESWTWKDLLASIDGADADGERLQDQLGAELTKMGVEPGKLLPKARIDEIAAAVQTGDLEGAREVVKRLAPAATRRIARRLSTDEGVKRQAQVYVRRYQTLVDDAVVRDPEGFLMANLLGDDPGRLYLLLDAAQGDAV
ncbi:MAG: hypothetical protein JWQ29_1065 [Phenylobacterium sp.]|nr:hypothetical protein [Phenylobacterium sp.]